MKRILLLIAMIFLSAGPAYSYDIHIIKDIPLKDKITGLAVNPPAGLAAAVSEDTKTLWLIDMDSGAVIKNLALDLSPSSVAFDTKRNQVIVASKNGMLQFLDAQTGSVVRTIQTDRAIHSIAIPPDNSMPGKGREGVSSGNQDILYIGNTNSLITFDPETERIIKETPLQNAVIAMAIENTLGYIALILEGKEGLLLYDLETLEIKSLLDKGIYSGIAVNPSTNIAALTNRAQNKISIISLENMALIATIPFNNQPSAIAIDPLRNIALIAHKAGIALVRLENPVPKITSLVPKSARTGDPDFMLSIQGSRFVNDSQAQFDKKHMPTHPNTNENLQASIPHEALTVPGDVPVTVTNPLPGGGTSNALAFRIFNPAPVLEAVAPETVAVDSSSTLRVSGRNFFNGSIVNLNGENLRTRFISSILLEAEVMQTHTKTQGTYPVVVINPAPGSFTSNQKTLEVAGKEELLVKSQSTTKAPNAPKQTGTLIGRIVNTDLIPLSGVGIKIKNLRAETDSDGYFQLDNIPAGRKLLIIDGSTEKGKKDHYPTIPINVDISADTINEMPFQVYFHKQKNYNFKAIDPSDDTILEDPEVPGFQMRIPKGVKITGWDKTPNLKVSVRTVPTDRLPVKPLPKHAFVRSIYMFYFNKIGGGTPDEPIPVRMPNDLGLLPGEKAVLWYYDESPNEGEAPNDWAVAGTGTVTPDGRYIVSDPGVGVPKFCCGATGPGCAGACPEGPGPDRCP